MAITLDGSHTPGGASSAANGPTVTRSITVGSGTNPCLLVFVAYQNDTTEPTCTVNSISMTKATGTSPSLSGKRVNAFYLTGTGGLTAGTFNVVLTSGQADFNAMIGTLSLRGVDQTTPVSDWNSATNAFSTTPNVSISNVALGDASAHISVPTSDGAVAFTQGASGETEFVEQRLGTGGSTAAGQYDLTTSGTVNLTHTLPGGDEWISGGFRIRRAASPSLPYLLVAN